MPAGLMSPPPDYALISPSMVRVFMQLPNIPCPPTSRSAPRPHDFILLATRREDPDTLFFNRRLVVEDDTVLGLVAKNTLDSIEWSNLAAKLHPVRLLASLSPGKSRP